MSAASFTLKSASTQAAAPFSLGHGFRKGDVPSGTQLVADIADLQVVPKTTWGDGSLKFAIISGRAALTGTVPLTVTLSIGTPAGGSVLTTADLKATGVVAAIDAGAFGSVSWATTDWDSPWQSWVSGPKMSSWVYRKQVGVDASLAAFVEVRLFYGGEVEVLPWIENGYFNVAGPTNKSETYTFTLGGTTRFTGAIDLKHHARTVLINGTMLSHWLATDPGITPRHDVDYMQASELVPTYRPRIAALGTLVTSYAPLQESNFTYDNNAMSSPGYQPPIGLLPTHDVAYLVCTTNHELLYGAVVRNGFSAGRYSVHFRDETTGRVPRFSSYPTTVLKSASSIKDTGSSTTATYTPVPTGSHVAQWDIAHCPSVGYMAYLVTGHWYHMEQMQFALTASYFGIANLNTRANNTGRFICDYDAVQTRSAAWGFRLLSHALALAPDADTTLRTEFVNLVEKLVNYYHATFVAQPNNPFGIVEPGENYDSVNGCQMGANWQQDFFTSAYGYAISLDLPIAPSVATKLSAFFHWKAQSIVGRLGLEGDFWYINAAPYNMAFGTTLVPNYQTGAGPWHANWAAVYAATYFVTPSWLGSTEGTLAAEYTSDQWAKSMWGNIQPAISYAVRHGVVGAQAGYDRMASASNFSVLETGFDSRIVWGIEPHIPENVPPMTMQKTIRCDTTSLIAGTIVCGDRGHGVLAADIPTGFPIAGLLEGEIGGGDPANTEYMVRILTVPVGLTIGVDEDGSYVATGADGSYVGDKQTYKNGVAETATTYTINIGFTSVSSSLAGSYSISGTINSSLSATYGIATSVNSDLAGLYQIDGPLSSVSSDLSATYAILLSVSASLSGSYTISDDQGPFISSFTRYTITLADRTYKP